MKLIILRLDSVNKQSLISESVTEIWINNQPCKGINQTTRHTQAQRASQVVTIHDVIKKPGRILPHPSIVFHAYASADTSWVARTLSHYISVDEKQNPHPNPILRGSNLGSKHECKNAPESTPIICKTHMWPNTRKQTVIPLWVVDHRRVAPFLQATNDFFGVRFSSTPCRRPGPNEWPAAAM
jgi:hypothetical protein